MSHTIIPIPAFKDNYIWMIIHRDSNQAVVVDPGNAEVVHKALQKHQVKLNAILITHHHWDHTDGIADLVNKYSVPVYGPKEDNVELCDHKLINGDKISLKSMDLNFDIIAIPVHTLGHIAFYGQNWLFCGDTLFSAGCGRLFEGTALQMFNSLEALSHLPPETQVYCGHEYTLNNLKFALTVEPNNTHSQQKLREVQQLRSNNTPTLPSTIGSERLINPFLRCQTPEVKISAETNRGKKLQNPIEVFATIRQWKDNF